MNVTRTTGLALAAAFALSACGGSGAPTTATPAARAIIERVAGPKIPDAIFGKEKAIRSANICARCAR